MTCASRNGLGIKLVLVSVSKGAYITYNLVDGVPKIYDQAISIIIKVE